VRVGGWAWQRLRCLQEVEGALRTRRSTYRSGVAIKAHEEGLGSDGQVAGWVAGWGNGGGGERSRGPGSRGHGRDRSSHGKAGFRDFSGPGETELYALQGVGCDRPAGGETGEEDGREVGQEVGEGPRGRVAEEVEKTTVAVEVAETVGTGGKEEGGDEDRALGVDTPGAGSPGIVILN
jgi:hypothetical protein